jgi:cytochrome c-type biogenesis protein
VAGFSLVFILLGASATVIGKFLLKNLKLLSTISGVLIIILGLHMSGLLKIKALYYEKRIQTNQKPFGVIGSFLMGLAFAFGWTPCIGPILAAILTVAGTKETIWQGVFLLTAYSLGLGIPFMITAFSLTLFFKLFDRIKKHFHTIEIISGILLIIIGILMITGMLSQITGFLNTFGIIKE